MFRDLQDAQEELKLLYTSGGISISSPPVLPDSVMLANLVLITGAKLGLPDSIYEGFSGDVRLDYLGHQKLVTVICDTTEVTAECFGASGNTQVYKATKAPDGIADLLTLVFAYIV